MSRLRTILATSALAIVSITCVDVTAPALGEGIIIAPGDTSTLLVGPGGGEAMQFTVRSSAEDGDAAQPPSAVWRSSASDVVTVDAKGLATARALGAAVIIARVGAMYDSAWVLVRPVTVASLAIALDSIALQIGPYGGSTRTLSAVLRDSLGNRLSAPLVRWRSSDARVAAITSLGMLTAAGVGVTWVHASADAQQDSAVVVVSSTLGPASPVNVRMLGAQWTQGIQNGDGSIPMLSGGRAAVVNITTSATGSIAAPTQFVLRLFNARGVSVHTDTTSVSILSGASTNREPTLQFLVPSNLLRLGLRWDVVRDPGRLSPGGASGAETFPATGNEPLLVVVPPPLRIRFVPVVLAAHGDERGPVTAQLLEYYLQSVRAFFPHGRIEATIGTVHRTSVKFGLAGYGGEAPFWSALVAELDARRVTDPLHADAYWIGVVRPPAGFVYSIIGGMGYVPRDGQSFALGTRTSAVVGANWFLNQFHSAYLVAHELGHNLGRLHAPCGTNGFVDATFPDAQGAIGEGAHDTFAWEMGRAVAATAVPSGTADLMGYCSPSWISAHTYGGMLDFRDSPTMALRAPSVPQRVLLVRGSVEDGVPRLDASEIADAAPSLPEPSGAWMLEGLSAGGGVLARWPFALARLDHAPRIQPFAVALPFDAELERGIATLRVTGPTGSVERQLP